MGYSTSVIMPCNVPFANSYGHIPPGQREIRHAIERNSVQARNCPKRLFSIGEKGLLKTPPIKRSKEKFAFPRRYPGWWLLTLKQREIPDTLAQAGLPHGFSQMPYFASRSSVKPTDLSVEPANGIFSADGRMIGIPCEKADADGDEADTATMRIVNNKSHYIERALTYAVHFIKSTECFGVT